LVGGSGVRTLPIGAAVVNLDAPEDTIPCLESVLAADPRPARVVVVDNGSSDDSVAVISAWIGRHPGCGVEIVVSDTNRGFASANNLALARLTADDGLTHFFLLNNDAQVDHRCFAELERAVAEAPAAGIMGMTIYVMGSARLWYAGGSVLRLRALGRHGREVPRDDGHVRPTEFVSACAMLISRHAWQVLGPLPECYFIYFEDTEYCMRARAAGLDVVYAPRPVVRHLVTGVVRRGAVAQALTEYRFAKSRALFARRNLRGFTRRGAMAYLVVTGFARAVLRTLRGRPIRAWTAFHGTVDGLLAMEGKSQSGEAAAGERAGDRVGVHQ
jgi:GT2 family glycosyltransferase